MPVTKLILPLGSRFCRDLKILFRSLVSVTRTAVLDGGESYSGRVKEAHTHCSWLIGSLISTNRARGTFVFSLPSLKWYT